MKPPLWMINEAQKEAIKSTMTQKHGAIVYKGQDIIGVGHNYECFYGKHSVHAEVDAILNAIKFRKELKDVSLLVVRIKKNLEFANSKPCKTCKKFIIKNNIGTIYYSS